VPRLRSPANQDASNSGAGVVRFVIDAQLPRRLATRLVELGHAAIHTLELPAGNRTSDRAIGAMASLSCQAIEGLRPKNRALSHDFPVVLKLNKIRPPMAQRGGATTQSGFWPRITLMGTDANAYIRAIRGIRGRKCCSNCNTAGPGAFFCASCAFLRPSGLVETWLRLRRAMIPPASARPATGERLQVAGYSWAGSELH